MLLVQPPDVFSGTLEKDWKKRAAPETFDAERQSVRRCPLATAKLYIAKSIKSVNLLDSLGLLSLAAMVVSTWVVTSEGIDHVNAQCKRCISLECKTRNCGQNSNCTFKIHKRHFTFTEDILDSIMGHYENRHLRKWGGRNLGFAVMRFRLIFSAVFRFFAFYFAVLRFL